MAGIVLYHGSPVIVQRPELAKGKPTNDFGQGFYCTEHKDLADEWACTSERGGFTNSYILKSSSLAILDLKQLDYQVLRWLALLLQHRRVRLSTPIMRRGSEWIVSNFAVDLDPYDLVVGYRADDSYFSFARAFLSGVITLEQLSVAMRLGNLGEQYVLKSEKAFTRLEFVDAEAVDQTTFYPKRMKRDEQARKSFNELLEKEDRGGITIRQLVDGEIEKDDERIR